MLLTNFGQRRQSTSSLPYSLGLMSNNILNLWSSVCFGRSSGLIQSEGGGLAFSSRLPFCSTGRLSLILIMILGSTPTRLLGRTPTRLLLYWLSHNLHTIAIIWLLAITWVFGVVIIVIAVIFIWFRAFSISRGDDLLPWPEWHRSDGGWFGTSQVLGITSGCRWCIWTWTSPGYLVDGRLDLGIDWWQLKDVWFYE